MGYLEDEGAAWTRFAWDDQRCRLTSAPDGPAREVLYRGRRLEVALE